MPSTGRRRQAPRTAPLAIREPTVMFGRQFDTVIFFHVVQTVFRRSQVIVALQHEFRFRTRSNGPRSHPAGTNHAWSEGAARKEEIT
jgi:hypothetical protein